jgi:hypothetical protein
LVGAGIALFVGYRKWGIDPATARSGVIGVMSLVSVIGAFTILLVTVGVLGWLDYRREECELTDETVRPVSAGRRGWATSTGGTRRISCFYFCVHRSHVVLYPGDSVTGD